MRAFAYILVATAAAYVYGCNSAPAYVAEPTQDERYYSAMQEGEMHVTAGVSLFNDAKVVPGEETEKNFFLQAIKNFESALRCYEAAKEFAHESEYPIIDMRIESVKSFITLMDKKKPLDRVASRKEVAAASDSPDGLSPEQRAKLAEEEEKIRKDQSGPEE